jgi:hypothetical protein
MAAITADCLRDAYRVVTKRKQSLKMLLLVDGSRILCVPQKGTPVCIFSRIF